MGSESNPVVWLRHEVKPGERRTPLTPSLARQITDAGYQLFVEKSATRCFSDAEYAVAGCKLVETGSWRNAPKDAYVLGLKELPEDESPLQHRHIYFGHCFKRQAGWQDLLARFERGHGVLLDLEYLVDDKGRRVAAFGRTAGLVGAALSLKLWAHQQLHAPDVSLPPLEPWQDEQAMLADVVANLRRVGRQPSAVVVGALGRCGNGAAHVLRSAGLTRLALWDLDETKAGGPFAQLLDYDIVVNCIYLSGSIPPFLTSQLIDSRPGRSTSAIVDVSCDTSNPHNPLPVYSHGTTLAEPVVRIRPPGGDHSRPLDLVAIDHLPTLLPRESSDGFAKDLLPHLVALKERSPVWTRAETVFRQKVGESRVKDA